MSEQKLNNIEETLAHHEQQIEDLNNIVTKQADEIDALKQRLKGLRDKIDVIEDMARTRNSEAPSAADQAARDKPPHY